MAAFQDPRQAQLEASLSAAAPDAIANNTRRQRAQRGQVRSNYAPSARAASTSHAAHARSCAPLMRLAGAGDQPRPSLQE